jgi:hypothetical protein
VGSADPTLARLGSGFVPHHPLVSYYLWLCLILDILKICMDFGPYDAFLSSDVSEMVDQQNSWNSYTKDNYAIKVVQTCGCNYSILRKSRTSTSSKFWGFGSRNDVRRWPFALNVSPSSHWRVTAP